MLNSFFIEIYISFTLLYYYSETSDLDTIYKVLKKAGEVSGQASGGGQQQQQHQVTIQTPMMDIPIVNVPDYPDRTPKRPGISTKFGPNIQNSQRQGLTAPQANDMSCSGPIFDSIFSLPT